MAPLSTPSNIQGSLADYAPKDITPHIGTSFPESVQLSKLISAPNSDELVLDLAKLVAHRGVVFFKAQDLTIAQQKELGRRMGELSGKPKESTLHVHPVTEKTSELGDEISVITSMGGISRAGLGSRASTGWHADISFEKYPSDYAILKMHTLPPVGGDTLWASGYEAYDRLSPAFRQFLEGLTAVHNADFFNVLAGQMGIEIREPRGHPENIGSTLTAIHPVIRTNPVTGFKAIYVNKTFTKRIVELSQDESDHVLSYLFSHVSENHDLQVRYTWSKNDIAIWDNRSNWHTATNDYPNHHLRSGDRVVSIGEKPYLDPRSQSRRVGLGLFD